MRVYTCVTLGMACLVLAAAPAAGQDWRELKGDHFIVRYSSGGGLSSGSETESFARETARLVEKYYVRIAEELGYPRASEFWTWDKRVKINIYPDKQSYVTQGNNAAWSEGVADYNKKEISSYAGSGKFLDHILPHDTAHLIFRDFVGFKGEIPLWLDEGVAQWSEELLRPKVKSIARQMYDKDLLLTLQDLMTLDIRRIGGNQKVYIRPTRAKTGQDATMFLSGEALINTYYVQSASLVGFLIEKFGSTDFASFCRELRDGKTIEDAVKNVYYTHLRSLDELEKAWREYIAGTS